MTSKGSRRDGHRPSEEKYRGGDVSRDRDGYRGRDEWEGRESHKRKERDRDGFVEFEASRYKEEKTSGGDRDGGKEHEASRYKEEKTIGRDRDRDGRKPKDEKEGGREKEVSKSKDGRESGRDREYHRSKDGREATKEKDVFKGRDDKLRDEKDRKVRDEKDGTKKDEKLKDNAKERESRWNREEKETGKEERIREREKRKNKDDGKEEREKTSGRRDGQKYKEEKDGQRNKEEKELQKRDRQELESLAPRSKEDAFVGKDTYTDHDSRQAESKHRRKEVEIEERRDRGEKRKREEEDGLDGPSGIEKKERGDKRKRDSAEESVGRGVKSLVSESMHIDKKLIIQDGWLEGSTRLMDVSSHSDNGNHSFTVESLTEGVKGSNFPFGDVNGNVSAVQSSSATPFVPSHAEFTAPTDNGINCCEDGLKETAVKSGMEGNAAQSVKGPILSTPEVLEKAKRALQVQKMLSERLKKLPQVSKFVGQTATLPSSATAPPSIPGVGSTAASTPSEVNLSGHAHQEQTLNIPSGTGFPTSGSMPANANLSAPGFGFTSGMVPSLSGLLPSVGTVPNYEALMRVQEFAARLGIQQVPGSLPLLGMVPGQATDDFGAAGQQKTVKAPVLRLDAQGREIDEHGNVVDRPKVTNLSTLKVNINKQKKEAFQILRPDLDEDPDNNPHFDPRMGIDKKKILRARRSTFQFVEEGKWAKQAEMLRLKNQFGEAQAKEIKMKQAALAKAKAEADINPNLIEVSERVPAKEEKPKDPIPDVEWWDVVLLPSGSYNDVTEGELKVKMEKLTIYVEHPVLIEPPAELPPPPPQPLKLTKKEQKKLRTQRRLAKEKDRQEMIRQGLIEPPKPKVKMSNLMKVLGAEATQDPTRLEMEIRTAAAEREQAHTDRNLARKLTPAERREKKEKKLFDDPNILETTVTVYRVNDLSHPQTRFKVDINAQENRLTGCLVMCDTMSVVIVEGGSKSIKRYGKLMLKRINWAAAVKEDEEAGEGGPQRVNKCVLVWQGSVAKPSFEKFLIQQCRTEAAARKYLADAGVAHYWDLAANYSEE